MTDHNQQLLMPSGFNYVAPYLQKFLKQFPRVDRNVFVMLPLSTPTSDAVFSRRPRSFLQQRL